MFQRVKPPARNWATPRRDMEAGLPSCRRWRTCAPGALADIQAAITRPRARKGGKVGIGYCWAALTTWRAARRSTAGCGGAVLRRRRHLRGGGRTQTARARAGVFRRAGPGLAAQHRRLPRAPPRCRCTCTPWRTTVSTATTARPGTKPRLRLRARSARWPLPPAVEATLPAACAPRRFQAVAVRFVANARHSNRYVCALRLASPSRGRQVRHRRDFIQRCL